jgi:two-component system sensor histidine kinase and response regulator WspE
MSHAATLEDALRRIEELSGEMHATVLRSRMRPFAEGVAAFPRMVRDISRQLNKAVNLRIEGERVEVDREVLQKLESPITHMLRNSLDHGIEPPAERVAAGKPETGSITLSARHQSGTLVIEVRDDGRGIDPEAIRARVIERRLVDVPTAERLSRDELMEFPFLPGFSTKQAATELSGRGVGLDIVRTMVQQISGVVSLDSAPGKGARFTLRLPVTRSVIRAAIVRVGSLVFAAPLARLHAVALVEPDELQRDGARPRLIFGDRAIDLVHGAEIFGVPAAPGPNVHVLVLTSGSSVSGPSAGLIVDAIAGEEDIIVRPLDRRLGAVPHVAALAIRADGVPIFVLDVDDVARSLDTALTNTTPLSVPVIAARHVEAATRRILVVDDSITVREVERQLLKRAGYEVDVAVDGKEGLNALIARRYDLLVTDVDMPRMTGIELTRAVRAEPRLAGLPIIIVSYKDREEDRRAGLEAGANIYLTKAAFHDESLVQMVQDLIGAPA